LISLCGLCTSNMYGNSLRLFGNIVLHVSEAVSLIFLYFCTPCILSICFLVLRISHLCLFKRSYLLTTTCISRFQFVHQCPCLPLETNDWGHVKKKRLVIYIKTPTLPLTMCKEAKAKWRILTFDIFHRKLPLSTQRRNGFESLNLLSYTSCGSVVICATVS
jgi:hypothetical protein